jgi:peptidoglycan hydrolase CwlO-like protein
LKACSKHGWLGNQQLYKAVYNSTRGLQARLEEQCTQLKEVVRERQDLESEYAALQKQLQTDKQDHQKRLLKSQTEQAVTSCELEAYKKQVHVRTF